MNKSNQIAYIGWTIPDLAPGQLMSPMPQRENLEAHEAKAELLYIYTVCNNFLPDAPRPYGRMLNIVAASDLSDGRADRIGRRTTQKRHQV